MMDMDIHELRSRILTQRDYLKKLHSCLDGLEIPAGCNSNIDGCRDHRDIRWIVKKLLSRLPNAEVWDGASEAGTRQKTSPPFPAPSCYRSSELPMNSEPKSNE